MGGTIEAIGGHGGTGIGTGAGAGDARSSKPILIDGATVTATGGTGAAAIGTGPASGTLSGTTNKGASSITIQNANVVANGGDGAAAIGAGVSLRGDVKASTVSIDSSTVVANGGKGGGAGIGSGYAAKASEGAIVTIGGSSTVTATGGISGKYGTCNLHAAPGIGGGAANCGSMGSGGSLTINGGSVKMVGGQPGTDWQSSAAPGTTATPMRNGAEVFELVAPTQTGTDSIDVDGTSYQRKGDHPEDPQFHAWVSGANHELMIGDEAYTATWNSAGKTFAVTKKAAEVSDVPGEGETPGNSEGSTGGSAGGNTGETTGGTPEETTGGSTGDSTETPGNSEGSTDGSTGGNTGETTGGSTETPGTSEGNTGGASGGSEESSTGAPEFASISGFSGDGSESNPYQVKVVNGQERVIEITANGSPAPDMKLYADVPGLGEVDGDTANLAFPDMWTVGDAQGNSRTATVKVPGNPDLNGVKVRIVASNGVEPDAVLHAVVVVTEEATDNTGGTTETPGTSEGNTGGETGGDTGTETGGTTGGSTGGSTETPGNSEGTTGGNTGGSTETPGTSEGNTSEPGTTQPGTSEGNTGGSTGGSTETPGTSEGMTGGTTQPGNTGGSTETPGTSEGNTSEPGSTSSEQPSAWDKFKESEMYKVYTTPSTSWWAIGIGVLGAVMTALASHGFFDLWIGALLRFFSGLFS